MQGHACGRPGGIRQKVAGSGGPPGGEDGTVMAPRKASPDQLSRWGKEIAAMEAGVRRAQDMCPDKDVTIDPARGEIYDFEIPDQCLRAFLEYSRDGIAVYVIATIDNKYGISDYLRAGYVDLLEAGVGAYAGIWHDPESHVTYTDSVRIIGEAMDDEDIRSLMFLYEQRSASKLVPERDEKGNIIGAGMMLVDK
ncbi:MAG: hypothetical protein MPI93_01885 [Nitrosopumilus sp.]|nr:hypothetical protein [Nitrosopumilus sp.]